MSYQNVSGYAGDLLDSRFDGFNSSFAAVNLISGTANSVYHGGSFQVRRQFARGFTLHSSFTFSKAIDESDDLTNVSNFQDASNRRADRAVAGFDARRKLSIIGLWDLPFFTGRRGHDSFPVVPVGAHQAARRSRQAVGAARQSETA